MDDLHELWLFFAHPQFALTRMVATLASALAFVCLLYVCVFAQGSWLFLNLALAAAGVACACVATATRIVAHTAYLRDDGRWRVDCGGEDARCVNHLRWLRVSNSEARIQYFMEDQWNHTPEHLRAQVFKS